MPVADRDRGRPGAGTHRRLVPLIGLALVGQLVGAAGALAGPWAVQPSSPVGGREVRSAAVPLAAPDIVASPAGSGERPTTAPRVDQITPADRDGPVVLSAADLWDGAVTAGPLGLDSGGALEVPRTESELGFWSDGARPGDDGLAVVVGHVDLDGRAGVFARLRQARPGQPIVVGKDDPVTFRVVAVDRYAKDDFPTETVYAPTSGSELRLITCGGRFDPRTGHYADNVVVRAVKV